MGQYGNYYGRGIIGILEFSRDSIEWNWGRAMQVCPLDGDVRGHRFTDSYTAYFLVPWISLTHGVFLGGWRMRFGISKCSRILLGPLIFPTFAWTLSFYARLLNVITMHGALATHVNERYFLQVHNLLVHWLPMTSVVNSRR
ncbi:hypothetical protein VNO77_27221 [Canavalia gladiata]|uniref:Uncharacterized protein n=1 Tax=Canavalia gladiata TaxID=3824 RepID=A0AAN9KUZ8_CANGL